MSWFVGNNRWRYFLYSIPAGSISILVALGLTVGLGYRDHLWGNKWDKLDWLCSVSGGVIGQVTTILLLSL